MIKDIAIVTVEGE